MQQLRARLNILATGELNSCTSFWVKTQISDGTRQLRSTCPGGSETKGVTPPPPFFFFPRKGKAQVMVCISQGERGGQAGTAKKLRERQVLSQFLAGRESYEPRNAFLLHSRKGDLEFVNADTWCFSYVIPK